MLLAEAMVVDTFMPILRMPATRVSWLVLRMEVAACEHSVLVVATPVVAVAVQVLLRRRA
jgi:hypothetical protein